MNGMDDRVAKQPFFWSVVATCLFCLIVFVESQDDSRHRFPTTRRRLPTVIITREHLRQQQHQQQRTPSQYGPLGDTAAEFVVSAGLDNSQSSAVRIRRIGNRRNNANNNHGINDTSTNEVNGMHQVVNFNSGPHQRRRPELRPLNVANDNERNRGGGQQHTFSNSDRRQPHPHTTYNRQDVLISDRQQIPGGTNQRRQPELNSQAIRRRQDSINERNRVVTHHQRFYPAVDVNVERGVQQYIPPIFVPHYQQHRNGQPNIPRPATEHRGSIDGRPNANSDQEFRTPSRNSGSELPVKHDGSSDKISNESGDKRMQINLEENKSHVEKVNGEEQKEDIKKPQIPHKHIVAETPVLRLKPADVQNYLIRRPSLVLRDQITVNEVRESSDRPRYGPRALQHDDETSSGTRRKRRAPSLYSLAHVELNRTSHIKKVGRENAEVEKINNNDVRNDTKHSEVLPSLKKVLDEVRNSGQRKSKSYPFRNYSGYKNTQSNSSEFASDPRFDTRTPYYSDEYVSDQSRESSEADEDREDVMSFSDFLASPIAEKIRLERQRMFRNSSQWNIDPNEDYYNSTVGLESIMENASNPLLRNIIAARLLHGILNLETNHSSNGTTSPGDRTNSRSSPDNLSSAEQRQFGIVVSPYDSVESMGTRSTMPIIRILRGKIVPLPDLPQELIPILLGTYRPTYTSETTIDDPKLTENILDNAILSLLQSEESMGGRPMAYNRKQRPNVPRYNRKSPSTNYVGSLKASEPPVLRTSYSFGQPNEWSMGPRCDRLTEEICLDDSDYPRATEMSLSTGRCIRPRLTHSHSHSSAIMSSIYKDKAKFDLMYAEVKTRESQVEGLSRQQEQAYSFDHYYGAQSQVSNPDHPRDYGHGGGFVCPSEVHYGRPHRAKNRRGEWKVVVNVGEYTQTMRMEKCLASGNPCKYVVAHMQSTCSQVYSYHRLLVFSKESGLHIDLFRVPTGCVCHLRNGGHQQSSTYSEPVPFMHRPNHPYEEFGGHVETAPVSQTTSEGPQGGGGGEKNPPPSSFGSTLWAILGGGGQAGALAQQPQFLDEVQKQIGWTQQMKQYPHLLKQISPNQVLKQLLDMDDDEDYNIRRLRIRTKPGNPNGYASHHVPISVPLPPPPPPPRVIARRPVVSAATPDMFGRPTGHHPKVIAQPATIYSLTKDAAGKGVRMSEPHVVYSSEPTSVFSLASSVGRIPEQDQQQGFHQVKAYKIRPGMFHPQAGSGEKMQFSEMVPVAPQFSNEGGSEPGLRPVLRPMKNSDKRIVEDADLIAIEKSEDGEIHAFKVETVTKDSSEDDSKMNFSYHPILEYLHM